MVIVKKFRIKLPVYIIVLLSVAAALEAYLTVRFIITLVTTPTVNVQRIIVFTLLLMLTVILLAICTGAVAYSYYVIKGEKLKTCIGIITTSYDIKGITEIIYFKAQGKLVMYYGKEKFTVILLPETKHEDFVKALREVNPEIIYDNKINEND